MPTKPMPQPVHPISEGKKRMSKAVQPVWGERLQNKAGSLAKPVGKSKSFVNKKRDLNK